MALAVPPAPYRFTRLEYDRLAEEGFFEGKKVELLDGVIVTMSPQSSPHAGAVYLIFKALLRLLEPAFCVRSQLPIPERSVEVLTEPDPLAGRYARREVGTEGETLVLPGGTVVAVAELLPHA